MIRASLQRFQDAIVINLGTDAVLSDLLPNLLFTTTPLLFLDSTLYNNETAESLPQTLLWNFEES